MVRIRRKGAKCNACAERSILIELINFRHSHWSKTSFEPKLMPFMVDILLFLLSANSQTICMCGSRFSEVKFVLT